MSNGPDHIKINITRSISKEGRGFLKVKITWRSMSSECQCHLNVKVIWMSRSSEGQHFCTYMPMKTRSCPEYTSVIINKICCWNIKIWQRFSGQYTCGTTHMPPPLLWQYLRFFQVAKRKKNNPSYITPPLPPDSIRWYLGSDLNWNKKQIPYICHISHAANKSKCNLSK